MLRTVLAVSLSLLVVVFATGVGVARGHLPPAGVVTICGGHGTVTIFVDTDGERVERQVLCPDCALTGFADLASGRTPARDAHAAPLALPRPEAVHVASAGFARPAARGPPRRA